MTLSHELDIAEQLARQAGQRALELQHLGIKLYKDNFEGPLTQGDLEADQIICEGLRQHFPNDLIISEETFVAGTTVPGTGRVWFVDPIDGTQDYVEGGLEYAVMIGLAIDGVPKLGVVFEPATGTLWRGCQTRAERIESDQSVHPLDIRNRAVPTTGPVLAVSHHHPSQFSDFIAKNLPISKIIKKSSVGLKIALVTDGEADAYISSGKRIKLWDTCAPVAILSASGGVFQSLFGGAFNFSGSIQHGIEITAATPHASLWLFQRLQGVIEKWTTLRKTQKSSS